MKMALDNTILRVVTGSQLYGTQVDDAGHASDRDELGVCIEDPEYIMGLESFQHFKHRDAEIREGRRDAKSQPGDLDLKIYGLRRFLQLAAGGDTSITEMFFAPPEAMVVDTPLGRELQAMAPKVVSKLVGAKYLGYMISQRHRLTGERGQRGVNRPELVEKYGFDTKYAGHVVRLGLQGLDLLLTDPPYGIRADEAAAKNHGKWGWKDYGMTTWDRERPTAAVFAALLRQTTDAIIWGGNYFADVLPPSQGWLVWDKGQREFSLADGELAWTSFDAALRIVLVPRAVALKDGKEHPTQKSLQVIEWAIGYADRCARRKPQTVLDPYLGTGTTLVAAKKLHKAEIAAKRLSQGVLPLAMAEPMSVDAVDPGDGIVEGCSRAHDFLLS